MFLREEREVKTEICIEIFLLLSFFPFTNYLLFILIELSVDNLKGRVIEACLADLSKDKNSKEDKSEDYAYRKMRFLIEDVEGRNCLTTFNGMDLTVDKLRSLVRKWQTTIEGHVEVKTIDGYVMRVFVIGFTSRRKNQIAKTSYAKSSQVREIRRRMLSIVTREVSSSTLKDVVGKFATESISKKIEKACEFVYPLQNVFVRKVKMLKTPKFDAARLNEQHQDTAPVVAVQETGDKVEKKAVVGDVPKKQ